MNICKTALTGAVAISMTVLSATAADLFWDVDAAAPLRGSSTTLDFSGSYFSTNASGISTLTTNSAGDDWFFQTDTVQAYTCKVDIAQTIDSITVSNGNSVTITTLTPQLTCTNLISIQDGSSLTFLLSYNNDVVTADSRSTGGSASVVLGAGSNTMTFSGGSSAAYWLGSLTGDADDRFGSGGPTLYVNFQEYGTFHGKLFGLCRLVGKYILTADQDELSAGATFEGANVTIGDGGTNGTIGIASMTSGGTLNVNRSDDYVFTNTIATWPSNKSFNFHNIGTGDLTVLSDLSGGHLIFNEGNGVVRGDVRANGRMWFYGPGTWTLAGTNIYAGGGTGYNPLVQLRNAGANLQIGDGTCYSKATFSNNFSMASGSDLIMDITAGAQLTVISNLIAGTGRNLVIIGGGQASHLPRPAVEGRAMLFTIHTIVPNLTNREF